MPETVKTNPRVNRKLWAKVKEEATSEGKKVGDVLTEILKAHYGPKKKVGIVVSTCGGSLDTFGIMHVASSMKRASEWFKGYLATNAYGNLDPEDNEEKLPLDPDDYTVIDFEFDENPPTAEELAASKKHLEMLEEAGRRALAKQKALEKETKRA